MLSRNFSKFVQVLRLLVILLIPVAISAQVSGGAISGRVIDSNGAVVPGVQVAIRNTATGIATNVVANEDGVYRAPNLLPGPYEVTASLTGFTTLQKRIELTVGADLSVDFKLTPGTVSASVIVSDEAPVVDTSTSTLSAVVNERTIRELPLNGRDWTSLATLQPGIAAIQTQAAVSSTSSKGNRGWGNQLTVAGHRPQENNYRIDGISINDYTNGGPGSVGGATLGADAIAEFSVLQSNYSAEYGRTSGGVINGTTRAGTNSFHGTGYDFERNKALDARNFFNIDSQPKPDFARHQFGGSAGGPIIKKKSFIFGDYEGIRQHQGVAQVATVPSDNARNGILAAGTVVVDPLVKPFLGFFPKVNGSLLGNGDTGEFLTSNIQNYKENFYTVRTDHRFSEKDSLFGTYFYDSSSLGVPDALNNVTFANRSRRQMIAIEESHTFSPNFQNALRLGYNRTFGLVNAPGKALIPIADDIALGTTPGLPAAMVNIAALGITSFGGNGFNTFAHHVQNSIQANDDAYLSRGNHVFKFGAAIERIEYIELLVRRPNGVFRFTSLANFLTNKPQRVDVTSAAVKAEVGTRESVIGGYFQDDWRLRPNLTFNMGLRYEFATNPSERFDNFYAVRNIFGGPLVRVKHYFDKNPTTRNFEPRVGIAWDPSGDGKTSLRAGFGIFDVLPLPWVITPHAAGDFPFALNTRVNNLPAGSFPKIAFTLANFSIPAGTYVDPSGVRTYVMNWHATVQRELVAHFTATVGYVGSRSIHNSFGPDDINMVLPTQTPAGFVFPTSGGVPLNPNVAVFRAIFFDATSSYRSLQVQVNRPMTKGFQLQGSYTWGKCTDTGSSGSRGDTFTNGINDLLFFDRANRRGGCDFDIRHNFVVNSLWNLPGPKGNKALAAVFGHWQLGGIFSASTGSPFSVFIAGDPLGTGLEDGYQFPDRVAGCNPVTGIPTHYINGACFTVPNPAKRMGNAGRNRVFGPSQAVLNFALYRNIPIHSESFSIQLRAEMFNALNHPNFAAPGDKTVFPSSAIPGDAPIANAGPITSTLTTNRQIQLGVRIRW